MAFTGHWDEGIALGEKAIKLTGPSAAFYSGGGQRRSDIGCGASIPRPMRRFSTRIRNRSGYRNLDLAYTLPFLGRVEEAKAHVAALLKMYPSMTIREADAFYKLVCFDAAYREKMAGALRQAGLPE